MNEYRVFGGRLRSEWSFPGLPTGGIGGDPEDPDGTSSPLYALRRATGRPGSADAPAGPELLGEESLGQNGKLLLHRVDGRLRLTHEPGGTYEIHPDAGVIEWRPSAPGEPGEVTRSIVLARALPALLHERGMLPLHAGGVAAGGEAVGFMAPKGFGKSTLALMMAIRGASLLSDDTLPLETEGEFRGWPGEGRLKVWDDAADQVGVTIPEQPPLARLGPSETASGAEKRKYLLTLGDAPFLGAASRPRPVAALYLLVPSPAEEMPSSDGGRASPTADPPERLRLSAVDASLALVACAKIAPLLHTADAPMLLERATRVAERIPVYAVRVPRGLSRLEAVADAVERWHPETEPAAPEPAGREP